MAPFRAHVASSPFCVGLCARASRRPPVLPAWNERTRLLRAIIHQKLFRKRSDFRSLARYSHIMQTSYAGLIDQTIWCFLSDFGFVEAATEKSESTFLRVRRYGVCSYIRHILVSSKAYWLSLPIDIHAFR